MSSNLLKKELDLAFQKLDHGSKPEKKAQTGRLANQLGAERHGVRKRMKKLRSRKTPKSSSLSLNWKFADPSKHKEKDLTDSCLTVLAKLDQQTKVSSKNLVQHHLKQKRQLPIQNEEENKSKLGSEEEETVFTDADFEKLEKEYFLHSKVAPIKED